MWGLAPGVDPVILIDTEPMKRLAALTISAAVLGVVAWWWTSDDPMWACGDDDEISGCISEASVDLTGLDIARPSVDRLGMGFSPDGSEAVVAVRDLDDPGGLRKVTVAVIDTTTGERIRVLTTLDPSEDGLQLDQLAVSPDGSLVALHLYDGEVDALVVLDATSGEEQARLIEEDLDNLELACFGRLGFSPDNRHIQCGRSTIELASGELSNDPDDEVALTVSGARTAFSNDLRTARLVGSDVHVGRVSQLDPDLRIPVPDLEPGDWSRAGFNSHVSQVVVSVERDEFGWSLRSSARSRPGGSVAIVDLETERVVTVFDTERPIVALEWSSDDRRLLALTDDLTLMIFDTQQW